MSSPSEWPAKATGAHASRELDQAGEAREEDRRLGEAGASLDAREAVLADELAAALEQLGQRARDQLAQISRLAALAREQPR